MVTRSVATLREAGYNLVFLICFVTFLTVALTAALPVFEQQVKRQKEAELIFRGLQIAEGIRVFQQRFGRYPTSLEEMLQTEPRTLRQLWADPMTDDGRWAFILASPQAAGGQQDGEGGGEEGDGVEVDPDAGVDVAGGSAPQPSFQLPESSFGGQVRGPIIGVVSRSKESSVRAFMGKERYSEWRFTAQMLPQPAIVPGTGLVASASVERLGRPFPPGIQPQPGAAPGTEPADLDSGSAPSDLFDAERDDG